MFQTSTPVVGPSFHDREADLEVLEKAIKQLARGEPKWVAILGARKIGKTSLVLEAGRRASSKRVKVVAFDVQEHGPVSAEIFRRLALRTLDAALGTELGESLERATTPAAYRTLAQRSAIFGRVPASLGGEFWS